MISACLIGQLLRRDHAKSRFVRIDGLRQRHEPLLSGDPALHSVLSAARYRDANAAAA